jgi:hypothetical protein
MSMDLQNQQTELNPVIKIESMKKISGQKNINHITA